MNAYLSAVDLEVDLDKTLRGDQGAAQRIIDHNKALIAAMAQAKREVWETIIKSLEDEAFELASQHSGGQQLAVRQILEHLREQAAKVGT